MIARIDKVAFLGNCMFLIWLFLDLLSVPIDAISIVSKPENFVAFMMAMIIIGFVFNVASTLAWVLALVRGRKPSFIPLANSFSLLIMILISLSQLHSIESF